MKRTTQTILSQLLKRVTEPKIIDSGFIEWSAPILSFGSPVHSTVATLGLNPSNREFVDRDGNELNDSQRRFPTLRSLGLNSWLESKNTHLDKITSAYDTYFSRNPYDTWFRALDSIIQGTQTSYYDTRAPACHLDLVPYATKLKWSQLPIWKRNQLYDASGDFLGQLLRESSVRLLILNGSGVAREFSRLSLGNLTTVPMTEWNLRRKSDPPIQGYAYLGSISKFAGVSLGRNIRVLGYNHNIQSSFGVTLHVRHSIRNWITRECSTLQP